MPSFPRFTQHLLDVVYPHYLAPTPSMAVVQFTPDPGGVPAEGFRIARDNILHSIIGPDEQTACEYRTAHDVTLFPIEVARAEFIGTQTAITALELGGSRIGRSAVRLRLRTVGDITFDKLALDVLPFHLRGADELPMRLYEQLLARTVAIIVRPSSRPAPWQVVLEPSRLRPLGFSPESALLPCGARSFDGYRLLHEYFAFPQAFSLRRDRWIGAGAAPMQRTRTRRDHPLSGAEPGARNAVDAANFALFCSP